MTAELRALNARFIHNFITNDVPSHDAILHKDFICIDPSGRRVGREEYLKRWATSSMPSASPTTTIATSGSTCSAPRRSCARPTRACG